MNQVRISKSFSWLDQLEVRIMNPENRSYIEEVTMKTASEGEIIPVAFRLAPEEAQQIVDQLWECGVRPSEGTGSAGSLAATQKHLDDMVTVAFHALKIAKSTM